MKKKKILRFTTIITMTTLFAILVVTLIIVNDIRKQISIDAMAREAELLEAPDYFLEPEGHIIARIHYKKYDRIREAYGYISIEDLNHYQNNPDSKIYQCIKVINPYDEDGKGTVIITKNIITLETGIYVDERYNKNLNR